MTGASFVARYEDERTEIACAHFTVERFLDRRVTHEDEVTKFKFVILYGALVVEFEAYGGFEVSFEDLIVKISEMRAALLESDSASSDEVGG